MRVGSRNGSAGRFGVHFNCFTPCNCCQRQRDGPLIAYFHFAEGMGGLEKAKLYRQHSTKLRTQVKKLKVLLVR